ncbi:MAG: tRNA (N(6)-L-threonylcarbamoyladenosine(37)-C(2))-methylthiotransferase MtaB [Catenisphaera adipataccumulans]|jgi:threonylcarbamoyladenosine tRNA methylthiotransferase MtaB|uniref:tRNA (N(6)-L-threonylcarbamoyladenosine(37)-C(2))- methylthiotransferase MtaB n=1 Tax=Catenisphaera adipataccumulans TaxID=700500 RepID=UPI003D8E1B02
MRFHIETLGCKVNAYESEYYIEGLKQLGYQEVGAHEPCDICIINTCAVTNTAAHKSRQKIHQAKKDNPDAYCVVVGCLPQFVSREQREALGADLIIGADHKNEVPQRIDRLVKTGRPDDLVEEVSTFHHFEAMPIRTFENQHRAFLKVQDGCNQFCSYCAIPFARGRERSLPAKQAVQVAKQLADAHHLEIVLTGIHTGRYHDGSIDLAGLLKEMLAVTPASVHFRISSIEMTEVSDELIELMRENQRICRHLHIPIQSGCDATLQRMNRPYTVEQFQSRIDQIRSALPDVSISTDVIAGFVQESEDEFETTMRNLEALQFSFMHVFPYSKRSGTKASTMSGEINGKIAKARVSKLLALSQALRLKDMARFDTLEVLIERKQGNYYTGYTSQYHPVRIKSDQPLSGRLIVHPDSLDENGYLVTLKR